MGKYIIYDDIRFSLTKAGYYAHNRVGYLHRYVWESVNGEIPEGHVVHHTDFNKGNNDLSNLQLLTNREHTLLHSKCRPPRTEVHKQHLSESQKGKPKPKRVVRTQEMVYAVIGGMSKRKFSEVFGVSALIWSSIREDCNQPIKRTSRVLSEEHKNKLAEASRSRSIESRKKTSDALRGKTRSEEVRLKISESKKGANNPMYGRKSHRRVEVTQEMISDAFILSQRAWAAKHGYSQSVWVRIRKELAS